MARIVLVLLLSGPLAALIVGAPRAFLERHLLNMGASLKLWRWSVRHACRSMSPNPSHISAAQTLRAMLSCTVED